MSFAAAASLSLRVSRIRAQCGNSVLIDQQCTGDYSRPIAQTGPLQVDFQFADHFFLSRPDDGWGFARHSLQYDPDRLKPGLHQLGPARYWKLRGPQPKCMLALGIQVHLNENTGIL